MLRQSSPPSAVPDRPPATDSPPWGVGLPTRRCDNAPVSRAFGRLLGTRAQMRSTVLKGRTSYRGRLAGAMIMTALVVGAPTASAQSPEALARARAAMDEAVKALDQSPELK